jgi:hypothetical protein
MIVVSKRFTVFLFFLLLIISSTIAQSTWEKKYYDTEDWAIHLYNAGISQQYDSILKEYTFLGESHGGYSSIYKFDSIGSVTFRRDYFAFGNKNLLMMEDGGIMISGMEPHSNYFVKTLFRTDPSYNILWKYQYDIPLATDYCGFTVGSNKKIFLMGMAHYNPYSRPFLIQLDSSGNTVTTKYYLDLFAYPLKIIRANDSNFLIAANGYLNDGAILAKSDSGGQILWTKSYLKPSGFIHDFFEKKNGNIVLIGNTETTTQTNYAKLFIMEVDYMGNTIWIKAYGDSTYRFISHPASFAYLFPIRISQIPDGSFIITGSMTVGINTYEDMILMKTDSLGNVIWERRRGAPNEYEVGMKVIQTPDAGYFMTGMFLNDDSINPKSGYYFLKTDSMGLVGCGDNSDPITVVNLLPTDSSFIVTDSTLVINQYVALLRDTTLSMPDSLPNCIVDAVSGHEQNELQLIAYPNPTTNIFHLHFSDGNSEEKNIFIYDLMGKEISSITHTFKTDFDFTLESKGIYLVKVLSGGKSEVIKVVVM